MAAACSLVAAPVLDQRKREGPDYGAGADGDQKLVSRSVLAVAMKRSSLSTHPRTVASSKLGARVLAADVAIEHHHQASA